MAAHKFHQGMMLTDSAKMHKSAGVHFQGKKIEFQTAPEKMSSFFQLDVAFITWGITAAMVGGSLVKLWQFFG